MRVDIIPYQMSTLPSVATSQAIAMFQGLILMVIRLNGVAEIDNDIVSASIQALTSNGDQKIESEVKTRRLRTNRPQGEHKKKPKSNDFRGFFMKKLSNKIIPFTDRERLRVDNDHYAPSLLASSYSDSSARFQQNLF